MCPVSLYQCAILSHTFPSARPPAFLILSRAQVSFATDVSQKILHVNLCESADLCLYHKLDSSANVRMIAVCYCVSVNVI